MLLFTQCGRIDHVDIDNNNNPSSEMAIEAPHSVLEDNASLENNEENQGGLELDKPDSFDANAAPHMLSPTEENKWEADNLFALKMPNAAHTNSVLVVCDKTGDLRMYDHKNEPLYVSGPVKIVNPKNAVTFKEQLATSGYASVHGRRAEINFRLRGGGLDFWDHIPANLISQPEFKDFSSRMEGAAIGATVGAIGGPVGMAVGALVGFILGSDNKSVIIDSLNERIDKLGEDLKTEQAKVRKLEKDLDDAKEETRKANERAEDAEKERDDAKEEAEQANARAEKAEKERDDAKEEAKQANARAEKAEEERNNAKEALKQATERAENAEAELKAAKQKIEEMGAELGFLKEVVNGLNEELAKESKQKNALWESNIREWKEKKELFDTSSQRNKKRLENRAKRSKKITKLKTKKEI